MTRHSRIAIIALLLLPSCASAHREPTNDELVEDFLETTFSLESRVYGKVNRPDSLPKWEGPIRLTILGEPDQKSLDRVREMQRLYSTYIDLPFEDARPGYDANYIVLFVPSLPPKQIMDVMRSEYRKANEKGVGIHMTVRSWLDHGWEEKYLATRYYYPGGSPQYRNTYCMVRPGPRSALLVIARNYYALDRCIAEEMIQALGLYNDTAKRWPSIMAPDGNMRRDPSPYDLLYLKVLYDPRLKAGMTRNEARPLAKIILAELRPDEAKKPLIDRLRINFHTAGRLP